MGVITMVNVKIGLADATIFKECITTICGLVSEVSMTLDEMGLRIISMDPANVALISLEMRKSEFVEYDVTEPTEIGVKLTDLKQVLGRATDKVTTLTIEYLDSKLLVTLAGKNGKKKEFKLSSINTDDMKKTKIPDLKFAADIMLDNSALKEAIADVEIVAESMGFNVANKKFSVAGAGDINSVKSEVEGTVRCDDDVVVQSKYSIEYLNKFTASKVSKNVKVSFSKDYPLRMIYLNDKGTICMMGILAPRIENN
jgi:proliferating cell nuclear antigen PCNA